MIRTGLLIAAIVIFVIEAARSKSLIAAGLAVLAASFFFAGGK